MYCATKLLLLSVFGYSRRSYYYTRKTEYQESIAKDAYDYFKKDYDNGKSRLFAKKQAMLNKQRQGLTEDVKAEETVESKKTNESEKKKKPEVEGESESTEACSKKQVPECEGEKERICALCCEKFGSFSYPKL